MTININLNPTSLDSSSRFLLLPADKTNAVIDDCHLSFGVVAVCSLDHLFLKPLESLPYVALEHLPTHLDRYLAVYLFVVI